MVQCSRRASTFWIYRSTPLLEGDRGVTTDCTDDTDLRGETEGPMFPPMELAEESLSKKEGAGRESDLSPAGGCRRHVQYIAFLIA